MNITKAYSLLGVTKSSTEKEIKSAYRKLAKQYHPDLHPDCKKSEEKFKEVSEAYEVLTKPGGDSEFTTNTYSCPADAFDDYFRRARHREAVLDKKLRPGTYPISLGPSQSLKVPMSLIELLLRRPVNITVTIREACSACLGDEAAWEECRSCEGRGATLKTFTTGMAMLSQSVNCSTCLGRGWIRVGSCNRCKGRLIMNSEKEVSILVPRGYRHGQRLVLQGKGNVGWKVPVSNLVVDPIVKFPDLSLLNVEDSAKLLEILEKGYVKS